MKWYDDTLQHLDYLRRDATLTLLADWDIGDGRKILADEIRARDGAGLKLCDDAGNGILVKDGGWVGLGTIPTRPLHIYRNSAGDNTTSMIIIDEDGNGDASLNFRLTGVKSYSIGLDNSDGDKFKISSSLNLAVNNYFTIDGTGLVGLLTASPTASLDINGDKIRLRTAKTPATAGAAGNQGDICWDADYFYICVATNTWERTPHAWDTFKFDAIVENTADNGVNIETVNVKDGHINELQKLIFKDPTELTISGGAITVTQSRHSIDTQNDDGTDDLVTINGGEDGQILILNTENSARDVTLKHGTGNILISGGDYTMDSAYNIVMLIYTGTYWMKLM